MKLLTEDAKLVCTHELGGVVNSPTQDWVTINQKRILVEINPEGRKIVGCPNIGATFKPCTTTLKVTVGYSDLVRIDGKRICLDTVTGFTNGTPPGTIKYKVNDSGQSLVSEKE
jgi:hypothetical protein